VLRSGLPRRPYRYLHGRRQRWHLSEPGRRERSAERYRVPQTEPNALSDPHPGATPQDRARALAQVLAQPHHHVAERHHQTVRTSPCRRSAIELPWRS